MLDVCVQGWGLMGVTREALHYKHRGGLLMQLYIAEHQVLNWGSNTKGDSCATLGEHKYALTIVCIVVCS